MNRDHRQASKLDILPGLLMCIAIYIIPSITIADELLCGFLPAPKTGDINISSSFGNLQAIAVGKDIVVAVGVNTILSTTDRKTWIRHRLNESEPTGNRYLVDVLWDGNKFVALSISGKVYVSDTNAQNWTAKSVIQITDSAGSRVHFRRLRFNKGLYVALSDSEAANVYLSYGNDALQWKTDRVDGFHHYGALTQMLWARDRYYVPSGGRILKSHLMQNNDIQIPVEFLNTAPTGATYDGNRFYRVVPGRTDISRSEDGKSWEKILSLAALPSGSRLSSVPLRTMRYLNGKYLIGGGCGVFVSSNNGVDWEIDFTDSAAFIEDINWAGNEYLAVGGAHSHGAIFKSPDGKKWKSLFERNGDITVRNAPMQGP